MEEPRRRPRAGCLAVAALLLGYSATTACTGSSVQPAAPSPGLGTAPPTTPAPRPTTRTPGTGRTTTGIKLIAVPRPDGSFDVTEDVLLPQATDILPLQVPASGEHLPGMMARTTPRVTNLKVLAGNQTVPLENTTVTGSDYIPLTTAANRIRLTYRLSGSTVRSSPSESTRAGAALRPLTASAGSTMPTDLTVTSGLLNAVCPLLPETRCAVGDPPQLAIRSGIPADKALVVVQLDLPR